MSPTAKTRVSSCVSKRVCALRKKHGISREVLAKKVCAAGYPISRFTIETIESGMHANGSMKRITVDEIMGLARAFGVSLEELMGEEIQIASESSMKRKETQIHGK